MRDWLGEAKAKQVYLILRDRILSGAIALGAKLPTEHELAAVHGVSRVTVRRALGELARERLIERRRSAGTRVIYRPALAPMISDISGMLASLADMGRRTTVKLLSFDYVRAEGGVAEALGVSSDQMLQRSVRVRSVDGEPFSYLTTFVPERISLTFTRQELASRPLLDLLERAGVKVERARQRIGAALATPDVAKALDVRTGTPVIELTRVVYDRSGRGVEHLYALYRPDRYAFEIDLVRSGTRNRVWSPIARRSDKAADKAAKHPIIKSKPADARPPR
ncbi:MAG: GntR family transcriptional regulator [Hyphomicrobiales bacterium]|nr:GntR family transcriptional regulator [Hyphomicrobiales bacterium]MDE1971785.1 GntR family transcriptional regulator [Hyphomicrobiales bacterium]MDE2285641.1 GntR family transcriptional regulator [Hyphomicrobiales bacterium]MDE2373195.1 GntR family transcriptional regulator [Hyphomicrobiales bacterium]